MVVADPTRQPSVSVVIPAYNAAAYISEALDSVFAQTFTDYEVIVVNDGSPDTEELEKALEKYGDRLVYVRQENRGPSGARNTALRVSRSDFLALLDSDDAWLPEYLAEQMSFLRSEPSLDMVYTDAVLFGDTELAGRTFMQGSPSRGPVTFESLLRYECSVITSGTVVRKQAVVDAGLFDEQFIRCEDFDLWLRLTHQGSKIGYQTKVLGKHRAHGSSLATDSIKMVESQVKVLEKTRSTLTLTPERQQLIERQLANCQAQIDLEQGKRYFAASDYGRAVQSLQRANGFYKSNKLRMVLWGLSSAPRALHSLYLLRQNLGRSGMSGNQAQK